MSLKESTWSFNHTGNNVILAGQWLHGCLLNYSIYGITLYYVENLDFFKACKTHVYFHKCGSMHTYRNF